MDELVARVSAALGVDAEVARTAVGLVLGFLQKESRDGAVSELLDQLPGASRRSSRPNPRAAAEAGLQA